MVSFIFFFFFQAEDGIRDKLVTGVQTCALPISAATRNSSACSWLRGNIERAVTRPRMFPNTTPSSSRARARDLSYTVGSHKLTSVVHTALVRSVVVFATRDDGQRIVVTSIVS